MVAWDSLLIIYTNEPAKRRDRNLINLRMNPCATDKIVRDHFIDPTSVSNRDHKIPTTDVKNGDEAMMVAAFGDKGVEWSLGTVC